MAPTPAGASAYSVPAYIFSQVGYGTGGQEGRQPGSAYGASLRLAIIRLLSFWPFADHGLPLTATEVIVPVPISLRCGLPR